MAATVYVSQSLGNDANTYVQAQSSATPWLTLNKCNTSATAGDTIVVMPGTVVILVDTSWTKSFTIQGQTTAAACILDCNSTFRQMVVNTGVTLTFSQLTFYRWWDTTGQSCWAMQNTSTISFTDCVIDSGKFCNGGVVVQGFCMDNSMATVSQTYVRCVFSNNVQATAAGYLLGNRTPTATNTTTITNCLFINQVVSGATVLDNWINCGNTSIVNLKNNIFYSSTDAIRVDKAGTTTDVSTTNCFFNTTNNPVGTGNITSDPLFVDAPNANYNIRQSSPCASTGTV